MGVIRKIENVGQFNRERGQPTLHPLVAVLDQSRSKAVKAEKCLSEVYIIFLKDVKCEEFIYGRSSYDYEDGTLLFIGPGQIFGMEERNKMVQPSGWALSFHPDFLKGTHLGRHINEYGFFSYEANEALHLSEAERQFVVECFKNIQQELGHAIDKYSRTLIISNIELFLNYCIRFYDRQFITREYINNDLLARFESLLNAYLLSDEPRQIGLPLVGYCAEKLNLSPKYFGDLIKKATGKSAQEYIKLKIISVAKQKLLEPGKSISEVAYELGFKYPAHFTRFFKRQVGSSPNIYRNELN